MQGLLAACLCIVVVGAAFRIPDLLTRNASKGESNDMAAMPEVNAPLRGDNEIADEDAIGNDCNGSATTDSETESETETESEGDDE